MANDTKVALETKDNGLEDKQKRLAILEKEEKLATLEAEEAGTQEQGPSRLRKALPLTGDENYEPGERSALGNLFERPGAANRAAVKGFVDPEEGESRIDSAISGYKKGAVIPEEEERFQDMFLEKYYKNYDFEKRGDIRDAIQVFGGFNISTAGLLADTVTNPAEMLAIIGPMLPMGKGISLGTKIAKSGFGQKVGAIANTDVTIKNTVKAINKTTQVVAQALKKGVNTGGNILRKGFDRLPKIMNEGWFVGQKESGIKVLQAARDLRSKMFEVRNPYKSTPVNPKIAKDLLVNSTLDTETAAVVDRLFGVVNDKGVRTGGIDHIDDVGKMYQLNDILTQKGGAMHMPRNQAGKGGATNPNIRAVYAKDAVKDAIYKEISKTDINGAELLKKLDADAGDVIYPYIKKLSDVFEAPTGTEGVASTYALSGSRSQQNMGKAGHRQAIRKGHKGVNQMSKNYIKGNYRNEVKAFLKVAKQMAKDMGAYRKRAIEKASIITTATGVGAVLAYKAIGKKLGGE